MPRHYRSTPKDKVINFALGFMFYSRMFVRWLDTRYRDVLTYFQTTAYGTIITDFLATATVFGILLFPVAMAILWIVITF